MPRDPESGQFVSTEEHDFDRFEEVFSGSYMNVPAADVGGQTSPDFGQQGRFEGHELYDAETFLDRDEIAVLLWAEHRLGAMVLSTETADGTVYVLAEVSASPEKNFNGPGAGAFEDVSEPAATSDFTVQTRDIVPGRGQALPDLVGRHLTAMAGGPFSDGATGVGGSNSQATDEWVGSPAAEPVYDVRDSIFLNGLFAHNNVDDGTLMAQLTTRHVYGVLEDAV